MLKKLFSFILLLATVLVWFVPKESEYFEKAAEDYSFFHGDEQISPEQLKKIVSYEFDHHLFYSEFTLQYGELTLKYHGFLNMVFFTQSNFGSEIKVYEVVV